MSHHQQVGAQMRGDAVRVFDELNESTKAQQAFLNSCGDATWISEEERRAIHWLLSALIDRARFALDLARRGEKVAVDSAETATAR